MLLDRRKIRRWAKWVALALAVIFALSFLFMGVGYGGAGFNISEIFTSGGCSSDNSTTATSTVEEQLAAFDTALQANPNDTVALLGVANLFKKLYEQGEGNGTQYLLTLGQVPRAAHSGRPHSEGRLPALGQHLPEPGRATTTTSAVADARTRLSPPTRRIPTSTCKLGIAQQKSRTTRARRCWRGRSTSNWRRTANPRLRSRIRSPS